MKKCSTWPIATVIKTQTDIYVAKTGALTDYNHYIIVLLFT